MDFQDVDVEGDALIKTEECTALKRWKSRSQNAGSHRRISLKEETSGSSEGEGREGPKG